MLIDVARRERTRRVVVNGYEPVIGFDFRGRKQSGDGTLATSTGPIRFEESGAGITVRKELDPFEHIVGFGEKAFDIERKRLVLRMWNNDPGGYRRGVDPVYVSIPFFISVRDSVSAFFINSVAEIVFDVGVSEYDQVLARVPERGMELFIFEGSSIEDVIEQFTRLTGLPFMPPAWSLGHQVSRFSYYPESTVMRVASDYASIAPLSAVYLDIDYMDEFKLFTWDKRKFADPAAMIAGLHGKDVKAVAIMDPGLKAEQGYTHFEKGIGHYVETANRELYLGRVWPGLCAFPDFFREGAVEHWKEMVRTFIREYGLDGLWLDMNEPSVFNQRKTIDADATHLIGGRRVRHELVHNAYAYMEARATFEALSEVLAEPFILSRSGYAGIQRYAAIWTGDSTSSWDDLKLQISMVTSLGLSGVPFSGCDLGGFMGRTDPELLARYYQMAAFFPVFRNHKAKEGSDQELFLLPERYRRMAVDAILMRYRFMPYLHSLSYEAHMTGHPVVRPMCYEFQSDSTAYSVNDAYMVGPSLLYAPVLLEGAESRDVYLPAAHWFSLHDGSEHQGPEWITTRAPMPVFVRKGSVIPLSDNGHLAYGKGSHGSYGGAKGGLRFSEGSFDMGDTMRNWSVTFLGVEARTCTIDGKRAGTAIGPNRTEVAVREGRKVALTTD